jgi:hypothetical protein
MSKYEVSEKILKQMKKEIKKKEKQTLRCIDIVKFNNGTKQMFGVKWIIVLTDKQNQKTAIDSLNMEKKTKNRI